MPSDRWAKHDAAMSELYERVEREKAEKEAEEASANAERARYLANPASSSETTLVPPTAAQPAHRVTALQSHSAGTSQKDLNAWDR